MPPWTEPGDPVLVLDNGVYGRGFADFVSMYGGKPVLYSVDEKNPIDPAALEEYLKEQRQTDRVRRPAQTIFYNLQEFP